MTMCTEPAAEQTAATLHVLYGGRDNGRSGAEASEHRRPAVADRRKLYHILHPADTMADVWTQDHVLAQWIYEQFVRQYGGAHLHVEILPGGQYDAECLLRTGAEAAA